MGCTLQILLDSAYFSYQLCECLPGLTTAPAGIVRGLWRIRCVPELHRNKAALAVYVVMGVAFLAAVVATLALVSRGLKALRPPGKPQSGSFAEPAARELKLQTRSQMLDTFHRCLHL